MKLLWITENYPPSRGGMAQSCDRIVFGLREQGLEIHVVHFTNRKESFRTDRLEQGSYTAVPLHENEAHSIHLCWSFVWNSGLEFDKLVIFGGYLPVIAAPVFAKWLEIPLITLLRGNDFDTALFTPRRRQMLFDCLDASEAVGCVTKEMMHRLKTLRPELKILYTPNGIRLEGWELMKSEKSFSHKWRKENAEKQMVIGMFGHLKEKKGLMVLINAVSASGILNKKINILLAGELNENDKMEMENSGIKYHLLPFLDRFELMKYYTCCDLVVIPSWYDGMPNVLLEAGGLGIPVTGTDTGGIHDVLYPEMKKMLFKPGRSEELRQILIEFEELTEEERKERGEQLRKIIEIQFDHNKELEHLTNLILASYETRFII